MLERDKQLLKLLIESNGKDAILTSINESEDQQGVIDSEYHVTFAVDCTDGKIDMEGLQIEVNSNVGELPFMIDDRYGLDKVLVTIGFNDEREAAEINEFVCNLMFGGSVEDYMREAELFYLGNVEALGVPISPDPESINESAFDSYKNKRSEEDKRNDLNKSTNKIIDENLKTEITKYITDRFTNDGPDLINKIESNMHDNGDSGEQNYIIPYIMTDKFFPSYNYKSPAVIGKTPIEVFPRVSSSECVVVIYFSGTGRMDHNIMYCHYFNDAIFDYIDKLEQDLSTEFEMNIIIKLRLFSSHIGKELRMLDKKSTTYLHKRVTVSKFIDFLNRFLVINVSGIRDGSFNAPVIYIDDSVFHGRSVDTEYPWSKSFLLNAHDISCKNPKTSFAILQTL